MKLTDLYAITSSSLKLSDNDLMLVADYNDQGIVSSKACSLNDLKKFINSELITASQLNQLLKEVGINDTISTNIDNYIYNLISNLKENGAKQNDFIILTNTGFSYKNSDDIISNIDFTNYITKTQYTADKNNTITLINELSNKYEYLNNSLQIYATNTFVTTQISNTKTQLINNMNMFTQAKLNDYVLKSDYNQLLNVVKTLSGEHLNNRQFEDLTKKIDYIKEKL